VTYLPSKGLPVYKEAQETGEYAVYSDDDPKPIITPRVVERGKEYGFREVIDGNGTPVLKWYAESVGPRPNGSPDEDQPLSRDGIFCWRKSNR
jgi:hypothetical protein